MYRLLDVVESLDIRSVSHSIHAKDARGARPYNPRMMLALLLYSYINGIYSSRQIAASTYERIDFRALTGDQHPFHTVVNEFRLRHLDALPQLFVQVLALCDQGPGRVDPGLPLSQPHQAPCGSARSRDRVSRRPEPPSPAKSPKKADPRHNCHIFKDSQNESQ